MRLATIIADYLSFRFTGVLPIVTQGYLICTSVLLVWQLSRFDEYTSFSLLLALAFYDLCAVLSPCGPLKALVGLMQERNIPLPVNHPSCLLLLLKRCLSVV